MSNKKLDIKTLTNPPKITDDLIGKLSLNFENNCVSIGDKYYYVNIDNVNQDTLYSHQPLLVNQELYNKDDGIYVYMIGKNKADQYITLVSIKVITINELGTKHKNILERLHGIYFDEVIYAGEFIKKGNNIHYNFFSGTYMDGVVDATNPDIEHTSNVDHVFEFLGFNPSFIKESIIKLKNLHLTMNEVNQLIKYGAKVFEYDTRTDCLKKENFKIESAKHDARYLTAVRASEKYKTPKPQYTILPLPKEGRQILPLNNLSHQLNTKILTKRKREKEIRKPHIKQSKKRKVIKQIYKIKSLSFVKPNKTKSLRRNTF